MPHRSLLVLLVAAIATLNVLSGAAEGQTPAPPPLTYERVITVTWKDLHDKILQMAKDTGFPDDKLEWKPHPDARSVLDEFRQVTNGLEWSSAQLRGEKLDGPTVRARRNATPASQRHAPRSSARWKPRSRSRIGSWKSLPRRCSSAGSVTRPSTTASSSPTTAPSGSSLRSAASPRRSRRSRAKIVLEQSLARSAWLREVAASLVVRENGHSHQLSCSGRPIRARCPRSDRMK